MNKYHYHTFKEGDKFMANMFGGIIGITLSVIMVTSVLIPTVKNTNTTSWTTAEITVFGLSTLMAVAGLAYGIGAMFGLV